MTKSLSEAFLLAVVPAFSYGAMLSYEIGYCYRFGVPYAFVRPDSAYFIPFFLIVAFISGFVLLAAEYLGAKSQRFPAVICILWTLLYVHALPDGKLFSFPALVTFPICASVGVAAVYFSRRLTWISAVRSYQQLIAFVLFVVLPSCFFLGTTSASKVKTFYAFATDTNQLVIRVYGDLIIARGFDFERGEFRREILIKKVADSDATSLVLVSAGETKGSPASTRRMSDIKIP